MWKQNIIDIFKIKYYYVSKWTLVRNMRLSTTDEDSSLTEQNSSVPEDLQIF